MIKWCILYVGLAYFDAVHAQTSCSATTATPISCVDFQGKLNRTVNVNDPSCYKIIEESCRITLNSIPVPRNHTYAAVFFNQLEFNPLDRDWVGTLELTKAFGQKLAVNNVRFSNALLISSGRVTSFSSEKSFLKTFTIQPAFSFVSAEDKSLLELRKSFGSKSLQGTSLPNSYFDVGVAGAFLLKSVNLSGSRINGNADLSAMTFNNVNMNNVTFLGDTANLKAPKFVRNDNQALPATRDQFLALTRKSWLQPDLELFRTSSSFDLSNLNFADKSFRNLDFRKSTVANSDFTGADLRGADFRGATGFASPGLILRDANLAGARFCLSDIKAISAKIALNEIDSRLSLLEVETGTTGIECPNAGTGELKMISDIRNTLLSTTLPAESLANAVARIWSKGLISKILFGDAIYGKLTSAELAKNPQLLQVLANGWKLPTAGETRAQLMENLCHQWDLRSTLPIDQQNVLIEILPFYGIGTLSLTDQLRFTKNLPLDPEKAKTSLATWESTLASQSTCGQRPSGLSAALYLRQAFLKEVPMMAVRKNTLPLLSYFAKAPAASRLNLQRELQSDMKIQAAILDGLALQLAQSLSTDVTEDKLAAQTSLLNQGWMNWGGNTLGNWNTMVAELSNFAEPSSIKNASRTFGSQLISGSSENPYEGIDAADITNNFNGAAAILAVQTHMASLNTAEDLARRHRMLMALASLSTRFAGPEAFLEGVADRLGLLSPYYAAHKINILSQVSFERSESIPVLVTAGLFLQDEMIQEHILKSTYGTAAIDQRWNAWLMEVQNAHRPGWDFANYRQQTIDAGTTSEFVMLLDWWNFVDQTESFVNNSQLLATKWHQFETTLFRPSDDISYAYSHPFAWGSYTFINGPTDATGIKYPLLLSEEQNTDPYILASRLLSRTRAALLLPQINRSVELSKEYLSLGNSGASNGSALQWALLNSWAIPFESLSNNVAISSSFQGLSAVLKSYVGKNPTEFPVPRLEQDLNTLNSRFSSVDRTNGTPAGASDFGNFRNIFKNSLDAFAAMLFY